MRTINNLILFFLPIIILTACGGGGGSSDDSSVESAPLVISVSNFDSNVRSYEPKTITINSNYNCNFRLSDGNIHWVATNDNKTFSYRAPITLLDEEQFNEVESTES